MKAVISTNKGQMHVALYDLDAPKTVANFVKLAESGLYTGVLSMAHAGRNTGGSQFFVCHSRRNTAHLDRNHTCFGKVTDGLDVLDQIREGDSIDSIEIIKE